MKKISCIIPAYNESARIENVLRAVAHHPMISEIIVVEDGSPDAAQTTAIVQKYSKVKFIQHPKNRGKSAAVCTGVGVSTGDFVFFLDSDLVGLEPRNISDLINPVTMGMADVSISLRKNSPRLWHMIGLDYISGERVMPRSLIVDNVDKILTLPGFGLEVFLNSQIIKRNYRVKIVPWPNVESPFKHTKLGFWRGVRGEIKMMTNIFQTVSVFGPLYQIVKLSNLRVK